MDDATFWSIIDLLDWSKVGDDDAVLRPALGALIGMRPDEVAAFENILAGKLHALDTREHARRCFAFDAGSDDGEDYISPDEFLYARCAVVANGRAVYESVLADPAQFPGTSSSSRCSIWHERPTNSAPDTPSISSTTPRGRASPTSTVGRRRQARAAGGSPPRERPGTTAEPARPMMTVSAASTSRTRRTPRYRSGSSWAG